MSEKGTIGCTDVSYVSGSIFSTNERIHEDAAARKRKVCIWKKILSLRKFVGKQNTKRFMAPRE